jgi:conjugal transfer pilus assembly protein TraK
MTAPPAQALQLVEASDGASVEAILSIREPTRIRIEGASITDVFGNIHSSQCGLAAALPTSPGMTPAGTGSSPINPAGEIALTCDRDKGEIYVRPVGDSAKPINLFVASANATYTLLLRRSDTPADTIVIRDRTPKALKHVRLRLRRWPARRPTRYGR